MHDTPEGNDPMAQTTNASSVDHKFESIDNSPDATAFGTTLRSPSTRHDAARRRLKLVSLLLAAVVAVGTFISTDPASAAAPPPNLNNEFFYSESWTPAVLSVSQICSASGPSTISFVTTGGATGPYPGTFTEQVTAVVTPPDPANLASAPYVLGDIAYGTVISLHATFTIDSGTTTITGTKNLTIGGRGLCADFFAQGLYNGDPTGLSHYKLIQFQAVTDFNATIHTATGSFAASGSTNIYFLQVGFEPGTLPFGLGAGGFSQQFLSSQPTVPLGPDSVTLSPPVGTNIVGSSHTVTATATAGSQATQGATILFHVQGSVTAAGSCVTDATGRCSFTYTGPQVPGSDVITGCADNNNSGTADVGEPCGQASKTWVYPEATSKDQCKNGGWQHLVDNEGHTFKNQGDCVSYVATKGKNKGAG
jgi:hypothetical protein